jgi:hypothetical protein
MAFDQHIEFQDFVLDSDALKTFEGFSASILKKSDLVLRDADLLQSMKREPIYWAQLRVELVTLKNDR